MHTLARKEVTMPRPKVFVTRRIDADALKSLEPHVDLNIWEGWFPPDREQFLALSSDCDGLLTTVSERVDAELMDVSPNLRVVSNMATGVDNVDIDEASRRGILIGRTPGVLDKTTAEMTVALLFASARRIVEADQFVRSGKWETWHPAQMVGRDLRDSTLGIIGLGNIGLEVAILARMIGMRVIYYQRNRRPQEEEKYQLKHMASLEQVLVSADFVSLHIPLTTETHHLISTPELDTMLRHSILINTARGQVVDQKALYEALVNGVIAGAALDVTEIEPIPLDDPLLGLPNIIILPHMGSATIRSRAGMADLATRNLLAGLRGESMPACANPEAIQNG